MNAHDATETLAHEDGWVVRCACGLEFSSLTRRRALELHAGHHGVMSVRAALEARSKGAND